MSTQPEVMEVVDRRHTADPEPVDLVTLAEVDRVYSEPLPILNYLLVRQNAKETTYHGTRFAIPESAQQHPNKGVVVAIGPELKPFSDNGDRLPGPVKPGDVVTFGRFNAEPIDIDGETYQLVRFNDIKLVESVTYAIN